MQKSKTGVVSVRISDELANKLNQEGKQKNVNLNTLINQIFEDHTSRNEMGDNMCRMFLSDRVLSNLFSSSDKNELLQLAETIGKKDLRGSVQFAFSKVDPDSVSMFIKNWLKINKIIYKHIFEDDKNKYTIQHTFGKNWSVYFVKIMESIYEDVGCKLEDKSTSDQCCSFAIVKI